MRALVWISENTWEACVDQARALLPEQAQITLLHVAASDIEEVAAGARLARLGRHPRTQGEPLSALCAEEAQALLAAAHARLARAANPVARRGRVEREVLAACAGSDILMLARDGEGRAGPKSLGPRTRYVVDHAPCAVVLVWAQQPCRGDPVPPPRGD
jgi:nucleotide-binding universal stress UspA family protein